MSDTIAQQFKSEAEPPEKPHVTLTITLNGDGTMEFSFPSNEILSYGLLAKAHAKLNEMALIRTAQHAQASRGGMNGLLKRIHGG